MGIIAVHIITLIMLGLVVGSFLNACIYRLPRDMSIAYPSSHCPKCNKPLKAIDLIPVFSYVFLGGRCRFCKEKISARYPIVELITAAIFVVLYLKYSISIELLFMLILSTLLIAVFFSDLETQIIPDSLNFIGIAAGLLYNLIAGHIISSIVGMLLGAAIIYAIYLIGTAIYKKEAMGGGDLKLAMMLGAFFGWQNLILILFLSFLIGAVISVFLLAFKIKSREDEIPFGPSMALAAFIVMFFGSAIWKLYLGM